MRLGKGKSAAGCLLVGCIGAASAQAQSLPVVIDGTTSTHAIVLPGGKVEVTVAAPDAAGTSLNRYSRFDVPAQGVDLNNSAAQSRLIINEITGSTPSVLQGAVTVTGQKAHVVLANPNGITIDGGSFVNTGGVVLTTGRPTLNADGTTLVTNSGRIDVAGRGLTLDGPSVDLIAKAVGIAAEINGGSATVSIVAGDSTHDIDPAQPLDASEGLIRPHSGSSASRTDIAINVSNTATLKGGAVRMRVTDAGAGVRLAGAVAAGTGGFKVSTSGEIVVADAAIAASGPIALKGGAVAVRSEARRAAVASSGSGVHLQATSGNVEIAGAQLQGAIRDTSSLAARGGVSIDAMADIRLLRALSGDNAELHSTADDLALTAGGSIIADGSLLDARGSLAMTSRATITLGNLTATGSAASFLSTGAFAATGLDLVALNGLRVQAASIALGPAESRQARMISQAAGVTLLALEGDIINSGTQVEGFSQTQGDRDSLGGITLRTPGDVRLTSVSPTALASFGSLNGLAAIDADGAVVNESGTIASNGDVTIRAGGAVSNRTALTGTPGLSETARAFLFGLSSTRTIELVYGTPRIADRRATLSAGGRLEVSAASIDNAGGVVVGDDISLSASGAVTNESVLSGSASFRRTCFFFCHASGSSAVDLIEARLSATNGISISAGGVVRTVGATFISGQDVGITAAAFRADSLLMPTVVLRPAGFSGLFSGQDGWFGFTYNGGLVASAFGDFAVTAPDISATGTVIRAGKKIRTNTPVREIVTPTEVGPYYLPRIGILAGGI